MMNSIQTVLAVFSKGKSLYYLFNASLAVIRVAIETRYECREPYSTESITSSTKPRSQQIVKPVKRQWMRLWN